MSHLRKYRLYTETDAAVMLGIEEDLLRAEREGGRIGYKMLAAAVMYRGSDLIRWVGDGVEPESSPAPAARPDSIEPERLYTEEESAALLGIDVDQLRADREAGRIFSPALGSTVKYRGADLTRRLNDAMDAPAPPRGDGGNDGR